MKYFSTLALFFCAYAHTPPVLTIVAALLTGAGWASWWWEGECEHWRREYERLMDQQVLRRRAASERLGEYLEQH